MIVVVVDTGVYVSAPIFGGVPQVDRLSQRLAAYLRWGKGPRQPLRFTKTGDTELEMAYATHFVWSGKGPFHPPISKEHRG